MINIPPPIHSGNPSASHQAPNVGYFLRDMTLYVTAAPKMMPAIKAQMSLRFILLPSPPRWLERGSLVCVNCVRIPTLQLKVAPPRGIEPRFED